MSVISKRTKAKAGFTAAKTMGKRPRLLLAGTKIALPAGKAGMKIALPAGKAGMKIALPAGKAGIKAGTPLLKRQARHRARQRVEQLDRASRTLGEALAVHGPRVAYELGLAEPPKPKRTAPRIAAGVAIGASAMYLLEPGHGKEHRDKVARLVS
jgi:hypothetical protein